MQSSAVNFIVSSSLAFHLLTVSWASSPSTGDPFSDTQRQYWAFQKLTDPKIPPFDGSFDNPIDAFILKKLTEKGLSLSSPANKITLVRRAYFDLTGLPPTPEDVETFLTDHSSEAFAKVVDKLLNSQQYGERWARHWLDLARYADSEGFKSDETRPNAWRYRDYVIQSLNDDKPYDKFIREQIAGDELWPENVSARIATAFNRHYPDESNQWNLWLRRQEILFDITDTVGATFMGLTYECAKCHDHKFDPLLQTDYYRLQAFFANSKANDHISLLSKEEAVTYKTRLAKWKSKTKNIRDKVRKIIEPKRREVLEDRLSRYYPEMRAQLAKPAEAQNPYERQMYAKYRWQMEFMGRESSIAKQLDEKLQKKYKTLQKQLAEYDDLHPGKLAEGIGIYDLGVESPPTHVLGVGNYENPKQKVQPGFPTILDPSNARYRPPKGLASTGRRTALANWLADPENPLTARVMVNRLWHFHFGRGIVATPSDFGAMGERPTHPELLDWLTRQFIRNNWSLKKMHRLIMTSKTYQQDSSFQQEANQKDPFNRLLWRYQPNRLEGEVIRDSSLFVAGILNDKVGGEPVFPPLPKYMPEPRGGWQVSENIDDHRRRSIYIFVRRNARYPMLEVYDMPDTHHSCARRDITMTAPQALSYLNNDQSISWAKGFAKRLTEEAGVDQMSQVDLAYQIAFSRNPDTWEKNNALTFLNKQTRLFTERETGSHKPSPSTATTTQLSQGKNAALIDFCHSIINSNEFVFRY